MLNKTIAYKYGATALQYVGIEGDKSISADSRPQCIRWVNKGVLQFSELASEIEWAFANGSGMIPGTIIDNFMVNRGGWNCRHIAVAILLFNKSKKSNAPKQKPPVPNKDDVVEKKPAESDLEKRVKELEQEVASFRDKSSKPEPERSAPPIEIPAESFSGDSSSVDAEPIAPISE